MLADGTEAELQTNIKATLDGGSGIYTLTITADSAGWVYDNIQDPGFGKMKLKSVKRNGIVMSPANFWQTNHTVLSDLSTISRNRLHFADKVEKGQTVYDLTYEAMPDSVLEGIGIRLYTEDNTLVEAEDTTKMRVVKAIIELTKAPYKFNYSNWSVAPYVSPQKDSIRFDQVDASGKVWILDMTAVEPVRGEHSINVDVSKLKVDRKGANGRGDLSIRWYEDIVVKTHVNIGVAPYDDMGSVDKQTGDYECGKMSVTAVPSEGYEFCYWIVDGEQLPETSPTLTYDIEGPTDITASFAHRYCQLTVDCDEQEGYISGGASAKYMYDSQLTLTAVPTEGHSFDYWLLDGKRENRQTIIVTMNDDKLLTAVFKGSDNATDISSLNASDGQKHSQDIIYNLKGQRVNKASHGIYISNGRKVVVK